MRGRRDTGSILEGSLLIIPSRNLSVQLQGPINHHKPPLLKQLSKALKVSPCPSWLALVLLRFDPGFSGEINFCAAEELRTKSSTEQSRNMGNTASA